MVKPVISQSGQTISIAWTAPANNSDSITAYVISIFHPALNDYKESVALCNGAGATEIANLKCDIAMTDLISTIGYSPGTVIKAKAQAINSKGTSALSTESTETIVA